MAGVLTCAVVAAGLAFLSARVSPLAVRAVLPLEERGEHDLFLTSLPDDPRRVLVTTRRARSTATRGDADQPGSRFWVHAYSDPARPGIPPRLLLTSRAQGARLLVPAAALDLDRLQATAPTDAQQPAVRVRLVDVYRDRLFAGVHLELRFPEREIGEDGKTIDHALVCVRGNRVRTTDFLLQPSDVLYREHLAAGRMPAGDFVTDAAGDLTFTLSRSPERPCVPLRLPLSLFDELALARGAELPELVDDRWRVESMPREEALRPSSAEIALGARALAIHLAARIEDEPERLALAARVARWAEGAVP